MRTRTHDRACNAPVHTERSHTHNNARFCEENFRDQKSNHKFHENIVPRKFGAIQYLKYVALIRMSVSLCFQASAACLWQNEHF